MTCLPFLSSPSPHPLLLLVFSVKSAFVVVVTVIAYWPSLSAELVFDDRPAIVENQDVRPTTDLHQLFLNDFWGRRLTDVSVPLLLLLVSRDHCSRAVILRRRTEWRVSSAERAGARLWEERERIRALVPRSSESRVMLEMVEWRETSKSTLTAKRRPFPGHQERVCRSRGRLDPSEGETGRLQVLPLPTSSPFSRRHPLSHSE